jgi:hypothetical protein
MQTWYYSQKFQDTLRVKLAVSFYRMTGWFRVAEPFPGDNGLVRILTSLIYHVSTEMMHAQLA